VSTLDNLRKTAKRWLKALRGGDTSAIDRLHRAYPEAPAAPTLCLRRGGGSTSHNCRFVNRSVRPFIAPIVSGRNVTFPARQYSVNGERRSFALLRPIADVTTQERIRDVVLATLFSRHMQSSRRRLRSSSSRRRRDAAQRSAVQLLPIA
jgi:hypothetical protein